MPTRSPGFTPSASRALARRFAASSSSRYDVTRSSNSTAGASGRSASPGPSTSASDSLPGWRTAKHFAVQSEIIGCLRLRPTHEPQFELEPFQNLFLFDGIAVPFVDAHARLLVGLEIAGHPVAARALAERRQELRAESLAVALGLDTRSE